MGSKERAAREKAERRKQREQLILSTAEQLFLEKGFFATTISDIAKGCELTNAAIYLYYKNKDELVLKVMTGISLHFAGLLEKTFEGAAGSTGIQQLAGLLNVYNRTFADYRNYHKLDAEFNMMFRDEYPDSPLLDEYFSANSRVLEVLTAAAVAGVADGSIKTELQPKRLAGLLLNALNSYIEKISLRKNLMEQEQGISMEDELKDYVRILLGGIKV